MLKGSTVLLVTLVLGADAMALLLLDPAGIFSPSPSPSSSPVSPVESTRPQIHAAYACDLPDRHNATSWLDFGWEYLDVLHFGGQTVAVQPDGAATWWHADKCNPPVVPGEAGIIAHAHAQGLAVLLAAHWNNSLGSDALYIFFNDPAAMDASASNLCARAEEAHCDGISLDFEVGNVRFNASFKGLMAGYIARISAAASAQQLTVVPTLYMDLPTNTGVDGGATAAAASGGVVLMTYDYHWGCSDPVAGPNTPLIGNNGSNVNATVAFALADSMPAVDLLLGIAWYGREYPTVGPFYQAATNCSKDVPDQVARAYQAPLALKRATTKGDGGELWDASSQTPWYTFQDPERPFLWWEGYYDNERSLALKYEFMKAQSLKGILIWMLNGCTQTEAPYLWSGLDDAFGKRQSQRAGDH
jgi:spore germination protein YaaH